MSEEIFRIVITVGVAIVALSALIVAGVAIGVAKGLGSLQGRGHAFFDQVEPLVGTVQKLTQEMAPKVSAFAANAEAVSANAKDISMEAREISHVAREQAHKFAIVGDDLAVRAQAQAAKMDALVDEAVDKVQVAGVQVKKAVMKPVHEVSGVAAGIKAAVATYAAANRRPVLDHIRQDEEMFI
jgi:hypothetical protein